MYLSPFKDVWGFRIIFAGPHKVFSKINQEQSIHSNHAMYSAGVENIQEHCDTYLEIREDRFNCDKNLETRDDRFNPIDRVRTSFYC